MFKFKLYDNFSQKELDKELWDIRISPPLSKSANIAVNTERKRLNIKIDVKDPTPLFEAKYASPTLQGPRFPAWITKEEIWDGVEVHSKKACNVNGIKARIGLHRYKGKGNIYLRGDGPNYHYLLGIDCSSKDIFLHVMDKNCNYIQEGRIHHKDHFKTEPYEAELGIVWENDNVIYIIDDVPYRFTLSSKVNKELVERLQKDCEEIYSKGLEGFCIRSDVCVKYFGEPRIETYASYVEIKEIK